MEAAFLNENSSITKQTIFVDFPVNLLVFHSVWLHGLNRHFFLELNEMQFKTDAFNEGYFHDTIFNRFCLLLLSIKHLIKLIK